MEITFDPAKTPIHTVEEKTDSGTVDVLPEQLDLYATDFVLYAKKLPVKF